MGKNQEALCTQAVAAEDAIAILWRTLEDAIQQHQQQLRPQHVELTLNLVAVEPGDNGLIISELAHHYVRLDIDQHQAKITTFTDIIAEDQANSMQQGGLVHELQALERLSLSTSFSKKQHPASFTQAFPALQQQVVSPMKGFLARATTACPHLALLPSVLFYMRGTLTTRTDNELRRLRNLANAVNYAAEIGPQMTEDILAMESEEAETTDSLGIVTRNDDVDMGGVPESSASESVAQSAEVQVVEN